MAGILDSILRHAGRGSKSENPGQRLYPANKRPTLDNLGETKQARKNEAQLQLAPVMEAISLLSPFSVGAALASYSPEAEAAFVTPRTGAKSLRKFADATLEHLPNPTISFEDLRPPTSLHKLYSRTKEGRDILATSKIPDIPISLSEEMGKTSRGRLLVDSYNQPISIELNTFPVGGEFAPLKTLQHEIQHVIDLTQKRSYGTNLRDAAKRTDDLKIEDTLNHTDSSGTIDKRTLESIWEQSELDVYLREAGENRARIDADQQPQFDNYATWYLDTATNKLKTGK